MSVTQACGERARVLVLRVVQAATQNARSARFMARAFVGSSCGARA